MSTPREGERSREKPPWKPREIIVHAKASRDPLTRRVLSRCPNVPVRSVDSGKASYRDLRLCGQRDRSVHGQPPGPVQGVARDLAQRRA
jgi:hypothetical protein